MSENKDRIDIKTGAKYNPKPGDRDGGSIHKYFPIINELAMILYAMIDSNCRIDGDTINFGCGAYFIYTLRKSKQKICKIEMGVAGCTVQLWGNHLAFADHILADISESMKHILINGRACGACAANDPHFIHCNHGGAYKYTIDGKHYERCRFDNFCFRIEDDKEREVLKKWIEMELSV